MSKGERLERAVIPEKRYRCVYFTDRLPCASIVAKRQSTGVLRRSRPSPRGRGKEISAYPILWPARYSSTCTRPEWPQPLLPKGVAVLGSDMPIARAPWRFRYF